MTQSGTTKILNQIETLIAEHGHAVIATEADDFSYSYTIGRSAVGRPELLVTGLHDSDVATTLLNLLAEVDSESPLSPGDLIQPGQVVSGYPCTVVAADPDAAGLFVARTFAQARGHELAALQLLWPDPEGNLPDSGSDPQTQPIFAL